MVIAQYNSGMIRESEAYNTREFFAEEEENINTHAKSLGGFLEIGGTSRFSIDRSKSYTTKSGDVQLLPYSSPIITVRDAAHPHNIQRLHELFGGNTQPKDQDPHIWIVKGNRAATMGKIISPYTPSLQGMFEAFEQYSNVGGFRVFPLAEQANARNRFEGITPDTYRDLVKDPEVLAGIISNRANPFGPDSLPEGKTWGYVRRGLSIRSENISLMQAINNEYGGSLHIYTRDIEITQGEQGIVDPTEVAVSAQLMFESRKAADLLDFVHPHLLFPSEEFDRIASTRPPLGRQPRIKE